MDLKILLLLNLFLVSSLNIYSQLQLVDARDQALGNATVACSSSCSIPQNIAIIPDASTIISCTVLNQYYIKDLSPVFVSFQKSFNNKLSLQATAGRIGNNFFSEKFIETGIAKKLGSKFSAGIKFQFYQRTLNDANYSNSFFILPVVGFFSCPLKNLTFGVIIRNPVRVRVNTIEKNKLPALINTGISYRVTEKMLLAFSIAQQTDRPISSHAGIEYFLHENLTLRIGWHTVPVSESFGFMLKLSKLCIDMSIQTHPVLGNSSALTLTLPL